LNLMF